MGIFWNLAARALVQPPVEVAAQRCARFRLAGSDCHRCVDVCPNEAITLQADGLRVDALSCDGCGLCQGACWSSVFSLRGLTLPAPLGAGETGRRRDGLNQPRAHLQPLRLSCSGQTPSGASRGGDDGQIPCLGALDPGRLAELASGRRLILTPVIPCAECQWVKGEALARENLAVVRRVQDNYGIPGEVEWEQVSLANSANKPESEGRSAALAHEERAKPAPGSHVLGRREWLEALGASVRKTVGKTLAEALPGDEGLDLPDVGQRLRRLASRWDRH